MRRLIIVFSIGAIICFCRISLADDVVLGQKEYKLATYSSAKTATLNIELRRISDNAQVPLSHMTFPITTTPNFGVNNPWIVADQYIKVMYDCNYPSWGIKIITDNQNDIGGLKPKPLYEGDDGEWEWVKQGLSEYAYVNGQWQTGDDRVSYGGLIRTGQVVDNPTMRADLGWQVRTGWWNVGGVVGIKPGNPHDTPDFDSNTPGNDSEAIKDDWKSNWAYIADKSNTGYIPTSIITGWTEDGEAMYNYDIAIFGDGTSSALAQHPPNGNPPKEKKGDGDVAIYIGARFCSKDYPPPDYKPVDFVLLENGPYQTRIYIELVSE